MSSTAPHRRTRQRTAVGLALASVAGFRTAQELHEVLRDAGEHVGLATVYRTLQAMVEAGEADMVRTPEGQAAYRACSRGHHHHLICRVCGRTVEISLPGFEHWASQTAAEQGFADIDHELELFGRCLNCEPRSP